MATQWQTFPVPFAGGLITNISPLQQGINAVGSASTLLNFEPSLDGGYRKVSGYKKFISAEVTGTGVIQGVAVVQNSGTKEVIAVRNGVYYLSDGADTSPTWTSLGTAASTNFARVRQARYNYSNTPKMVFVDGTNYPAYYTVGSSSITYITASTDSDGNTVATNVNTPVQGASHVCVFKNTMFFGVGTELVFTAPYTPDDFDPANGAGSIGVGGEITGLIVFRDQLIIFTTDKIFRLTGSTGSDFSLIPITEDLGCLSADTIQEVGADVMFLGPDGLRTLSSTERIGDFGIDVASKNIRPTVKNLTTYASNFASLVIRGKAQYRFFAYVSGETATVAKGVLGTKFVDQGGQGFQWAELQGFKVYVADSQFIDSDEYRLFANEDGYIYEMDVTTSRDGSTINSVYESPFMPINDPQVRKTFYKLDLYIKPSGAINITAGLRFNQDVSDYIQPSTFSITQTGSTIALYDDNNTVYRELATQDNAGVYGEPKTQSYKNQVVGSGETVAIRITDDSSDADFLLDTAIFEFTTNDRQ
jgi:hypothetical protein